MRLMTLSYVWCIALSYRLTKIKQEECSFLKILCVLLYFIFEAHVWAAWGSRTNRIQVVLLCSVSLTGISQSPMWLRGPIRRFWFYFRLFQSPGREYTEEDLRENEGLNNLQGRLVSGKARTRDSETKISELKTLRPCNSFYFGVTRHPSIHHLPESDCNF